MTAPGKSANSRIRKLPVHADAKFRRGDLVIVSEMFLARSTNCGEARVPKAEAILHDRISVISYRVRFARIAV